MIEPLANSLNYQIAARLLDGAVIRHEAIATNIANAETPGFRRIDLSPDFARTLRAQIATGKSTAVAELRTLRPTLAEDPHARSERADGNNVEIESELMAMSRNHVNHEFLTEMLTRHIKGLKMAITGRVI